MTLLLGLLTVLALAHDLETRVTLAAPAVIVLAEYGGSEPVPFAQVQVFAPDGKEHQSGVTDRRGYASFVPSGPGPWRVVIDDQEGHRTETAVEVPSSFESKTAASSSEPRASRMERALLGVALIFGATGFLYGAKARRPA